MTMIDYAYIALIATLVIMHNTPRGILETVVTGLGFFCICLIAGKLFDIMKDK